MKKILYLIEEIKAVKRIIKKRIFNRPLTIKDEDGNCVVVVEDIMFSKGRIRKNYNSVAKTVRALLRDLDGESVFVKDANKRVFFDKIFPDEFTYSKDTRRLYSKDVTAKMNAVKEIKHIIRKAKYIKHSPLKESKKAAKKKRRVDATNGFDYYQLYFAYKNEKENEYQIYSAILNTRIDKNKKSFIYDITKTSKIRRNGTKPINYRQKL